MINAFTVDVEEWFHVCGVPALAEPSAWDALESRVVADTAAHPRPARSLRRRATCFVLGWVAERHPRLVARIRDAGHEIGSHGQWHRRVYELDADAFTRDLRLAQRRADRRRRAAGHAVPRAGMVDQRPRAVGARAPRRPKASPSTPAARRSASSEIPCIPSTPHTIATPRGPIVEAPPAVERRFGQRMPFGGGWGLRMSRPGRVIREIARRNARGEPVTCWIHPWELDPDPPRMTLPAGVPSRTTSGCPGWMSRLETILRGAPFGTMSEMLAALPTPPRPD